MVGAKLDATDRKILAELQAEGRVTNVELSARVGISAPPCLRRVRALEHSGLIQGYHARVNPRLLGFELTVFVMVRLDKQSGSDLERFEAQCQAWPMVRECHMLNGDVDFMLKCVAATLPTFQQFLTDELTAAANISSVKTSLVIRSEKQEPGVPFEMIAPPRHAASAGG